MDFKQMQVKAKKKIKKGEEKLHKVYDLRNVEQTVDLIMGIDGGSTQNRVVILDSSINPSEQYIIPSPCVKLEDDREVIPNTEDLADRLDSFIVGENPSKTVYIGKERVLRGTKMVNTGIAASSLTSSVLKIDEPMFYINIIDAIGYALCQHYNDEIPTKVNLVAGIALPPEDMKFSKQKKKFLDNIVGRYTWTHKDSGVKIAINIMDVELATEPEAFVKAYYAVNGLEMPELVGCINTGGRSIGAELMFNGERIAPASKAFRYGGNQFLRDLQANCGNSEKNLGEPSIERLEDAVLSGKLKVGNSTIDIVDEIKLTCQQYGKKLMDDTIKEVIDVAGKKLIDLNELVFCGGLARGGEYEISVADSYGDLLEGMSPQTDYIVVEDNLIPLGLTFIAFNKNADLLLAEDGEDEEVEGEIVATQEVEGDFEGIETPLNFDEE